MEVPRRCPECGEPVSASTVYCPQCDAPIAESPNAITETPRTWPPPAEARPRLGPSKPGSGTILARIGIGCVVVPTTILIVLIAGCSIWWSHRPRDVGYQDVLTASNASTFAQHNQSWNSDDPNNVAYVQRSLEHLGSRAYGRKFGDLMDWEKAFEQQQEARKAAAAEVAYDRSHPTPTAEPASELKAEALAKARLCYDSLLKLMDEFHSGQERIANEQSSGDDVSALTDARAFYSRSFELATAVDSVECPDDFSDAVGDARDYLQTGTGLLKDEEKLIRSYDIDVAADAKSYSQSMLAAQIQFASHAMVDYVKMGGSAKELVNSPTSP